MTNRHIKRRFPRGFQFYLGLIVSFAAFAWLFRSVDAGRTLDRLQSVQLPYLFTAIALTVLSYFLRAWRWLLFFDRGKLHFWTSYRCVIVGFVMNNLLPARMGELVRAHLGGKALNTSRATVLATIAGERLIDGLMISLLFALLFSLGACAQDQAEGHALFLVAYGFAGATAGTAFVLWNRRRIFALLDRIAAHRGAKAAYTVRRMRSFIEGLEPMFRRDRFTVLGFASLAIWLVELFIYAFIARAFSTPLTIANTSLFFAAVNFSSLIPAAPGGIGVIEAFATAALVHIGVDPDTAFAMVATQHLIQIAVVGLPGSVLFFSRLQGRIPVSLDSNESSDEVTPREQPAIEGS